MSLKSMILFLTVLIVSFSSCSGEAETSNTDPVSDDTDLITEETPVIERPEMVYASHILLAYQGADRSAATRTKEEALGIIEGLQESISDGSLTFIDAAAANSDCPSSSNGGDLGPFPRGVMAIAFEEAAFELEPGDISDIVETPFGYHLIMRTE